jgi:repressor LexA
MINVGINDGDYLIVQESHEAANGEIVVALVNDDYEPGATVKRFYRERDHIRLQPENDFMDPIIAHDVTIVGKVKGVFRYFN